MKRKKLKAIIITAVCAAVVAAAASLCTVFINLTNRYSNLEGLISSGEYSSAKQLYEESGSLFKKMYSSQTAPLLTSKLNEAFAALDASDYEQACKLYSELVCVFPEYKSDDFCKSVTEKLYNSVEREDFETARITAAFLAEQSLLDLEVLTTKLEELSFAKIKNAFSEQNATPMLSSKLKGELEEILEFSNNYLPEDDCALCNFLVYYIDCCDKYGKSCTVYSALKKCESFLDEAQEQFTFALSYAGNRDKSHAFALKAYELAEKAYYEALTFSTLDSQAALEVINLCQGYMANAKDMSKWERNPAYLACRSRQNSLNSERRALNSEHKKTAESCRDCYNPELSAALNINQGLQ